jgi:uncharacterized protein (TIGR02246 family)
MGLLNSNERRFVMRFLTLLICGALALVGGGLFADEKSEADLFKIGELNEAYVTAFNSHDLKKVASVFTADGDFTLLTGDTLSGREQVAGGHASFFKNNPNAQISGKQLTRRLVQDDVLLATGVWQVKNGPQEYAASGMWSTVVVKRKGQWKYEAMRLMVPATPTTN